MDSVEHCANSFTSVLFCELCMIAHTTPYVSFSCIMEEDVCIGGLYTELFTQPCFLTLCQFAIPTLYYISNVWHYWS